MATYVKSINGYEGSLPFHEDPGITLDASDIHISGSTGDTVRQKAVALANGITMITAEETETAGDYKIRIGNYPLSLTT